MQDDRLGGARRENRPRRRPSPTTDPADPTAPGALPRTRKRLERTITDDPAHHTRETHSDTPEQLYGRGGRVRADRPPQPSCSTSSKPPPNNLQSLLRIFCSTTLLHPPLYEKKGRSRGRRGVAERKGRSRRSGEGVKFPGPGLADRGRDRTRAGPRPGVGALARVGLTGRNPAGITTTLRDAPVPGVACAMRAQRNAIHPTSRHANSARRSPPACDPREPASHNAT